MSQANELATAIERAADVGNLIEMRLDCLPDDERDMARAKISARVRDLDRPVILTLRAAEQGGHNQLSYEDRRRFWSSPVTIPADCFIDLELDLTRDLGAAVGLERVICSHHDLVGVPTNLEQIYEQMAATGARILKIAVQADDATDCLPVFRLLDRAQREGREMIAIAMGPAGIMTRVLGPSRGSFLTYGSLDDESATAPGQLTARELREVYRIDQIDRQTEVVGIIGKPVGHSLSPHIHNAAFAAAGLNAVYVPFEVHNANEFMRRMVQPRSREIDWNLRGLSVTAPHKLIVMDRLDWIEPSAKEMRSVNTIVAHGEELHGYNTDAGGFISPLRQKFGSLHDAHCAVIGAGGAARAALWALRRGGAQVDLFARDPTFAEYFAQQFGARCKSLVEATFGDFDVVINATPLGTRGERENETPAKADQLQRVRLAYDLVYNPFETRFLREARAAGCDTLSGLEMLIAQAAEQFELWTGKQPDVGVMREAALAALSRE